MSTLLHLLGVFSLCDLSIALQYDCGANHEVFDNKVIPALEAKGYVVEQGYLRWYGNQSAYAANPSLFYGLYVFNRSKPLDPSFQSFSAEWSESSQSDEHFSVEGIRPHMKYDEFWFMHGSAAMLWYGCHAPAKYYSYRSYQNRRFNPKHPLGANSSQQDNQKWPESDPYGSLGDMLNNANIHSTTKGLQLIVSTPDNRTFSDVYRLSNDHLDALKLTDSRQINLDVMPWRDIPVDGPGFLDDDPQDAAQSTNVYYLKYPNGLGGWEGAARQIENGETLDGIGIMVRFGLPLDDRYALYLNTTQRVYKIYYPYNRTEGGPDGEGVGHGDGGGVQSVSASDDSHWDVPREAFAAPFVHNLTTGIFEQETLEPAFTAYSKMVYSHFNVEHRSRYQWRYESTKISSPFYEGNHEYGFDCIKYGTRCMADNRDAQYFLTWPDVSVLSNSSILLILGVVHEDTGKCQWENLVPYFANSGVHSKFYRSHYLDYMAPKYRGSALTFPPAANGSIAGEELEKLFIVAAMRTEMCERYFDNEAFPELRGVPKFCFDGNDFNYSSPQRWFMVHRCYINPATQTRPDAKEMIPFVTMQFDTQWFEWNTA